MVPALSPRRGLPASWRLASAALALAGCARTAVVAPAPARAADSRVGLKAGLTGAGEATWNLKVSSATPATAKFKESMNSDLAFTGNYAIQGNFNGFQVWDITNPSKPVLKTSYYCPASQSDVSVYKNLLFVSGEGMEGRLDCGDQGNASAVSKERLRGIRIFDITDIMAPKYIANVQTCRGSHTHTVVEDPKDRENVYIYVSGSAPVRPEAELPGCVGQSPDKNPNSSLFKVEIIQVPLAHPEQAKIINRAQIFEDLAPVHGHSEAPEDIARAKATAAAARARGEFTADVMGMEMVIPPQFTKPMLDSISKARGGTSVSAADSTTLREALPGIIAKMIGAGGEGPRRGPNQCHDITVYPGVGLAGGACEGYGLLLDIRDVKNPVRIAAAADTNFAYWHSATFNNDGTKVLFSDEWGGGGGPKCRATDKKEWGSDAMFTIENGKLVFQGYYKMPAAQTDKENCVAHNGSLIPVPGRDVMVQAWYQGGISVFDWTDPKHPVEIAYHDRGPVDSTRMAMGGSWSVYWYNGSIVSSEIARGLDVFELTPSQYLTQNELDAAKTVRWSYLNAQGQPKIVWPPSFALARAYIDQLERNKCLSAARIASVRSALAGAEKASASARRDALTTLASQLDGEARSSCDAPRVGKLSTTLRDLSSVVP